MCMLRKWAGMLSEFVYSVHVHACVHTYRLRARGVQWMGGGACLQGSISRGACLEVVVCMLIVRSMNECTHAYVHIHIHTHAYVIHLH